MVAHDKPDMEPDIEPDMDGSKDAGDGGLSIPLSDAPLSDDSLLDMLDALVNDRGKVAAAEALGVNYRTMVTCHESRHVSRRMRKALAEFRDATFDGGGEHDDDAGDVMEKVAALEERVAALEEAHGVLMGTVETQAKELAELERKVEGTTEGERRESEAEAPDDGEEGQRREWWPPRREHGLPDAGVVTVKEQPDEGHAFGPAAQLVAEWRRLRTQGEASGGRFDRAWASVRRWEFEIAMLRDYGLTLPPETEPLDASRREDHLRWRKEALEEAWRELAKARRVLWLRRAFTFGAWWR